MQFSTYLKAQRKKNKYTQNSLANKLAEFNSDFAEIDANTISRWERGSNEPSQERQRLCVLFFGDDPSEYLPFSSAAIEDALNGTSSARSQVKRSLKQQRFNMLIGGFPLSGEAIEISEYQLADDKGGYLEHIASLDVGILETTHPTTADTFAAWISQYGGQIWVGKRHHQVLMHLVLLRLKPYSFEQIMTQQRLESSITAADLAQEGEPFCLLLVNFFSQSSDIAVEMFIEVIGFLYQQRKCVLQMGSLLANMDGVKLCSMLSMQFHSFGPLGTKGAISHQGKHFQWATMVVTVSELLASPLARKCISQPNQP